MSFSQTRKISAMTPLLRVLRRRLLPMHLIKFVVVMVDV
ncbi:hypothetical protein CPAR01_11783 [Colletotrichum paranaense]|uniref:Uncharacterized protein n=1 Tax=Colletotrichum paranaense TaxID=1914294 RepID=A0ABQ9S865_9PEZI|nr:uncharacterized protein CPAR01_11783 [Colletotrichum paranaense]KAK1529471.1 hypothetical protein CPAR01_11783 [Colletotrichum paranaense]